MNSPVSESLQIDQVEIFAPELKDGKVVHWKNGLDILPTFGMTADNVTVTASADGHLSITPSQMPTVKSFFVAFGCEEGRWRKKPPAQA